MFMTSMCCSRLCSRQQLQKQVLVLAAGECMVQQLLEPHQGPCYERRCYLYSYLVSSWYICVAIS